MTLVIKGWENVQANLRRLADQYPQELGYALREEGMAVMDESMKQCPLDQDNVHEDGSLHLVDTADIQGPYFEDGNITVTLSYDTPYAVIQHENLDFHHTSPGTKAKYLEDPLTERARFIGPNLARAVNLERMGTGYFAAPTKSLKKDLGVKNMQKKAFGSWAMFEQQAYRWEGVL